MNQENILYQGSVKTVLGEKGRSPYIFNYTDSFSVFDWGALPDDIPLKGTGLAYMAWYFFEYLGKSKNWSEWDRASALIKDPELKDTLHEFMTLGVPHHCQLDDEESGPVFDPNSPRPILAVNAVNVVPPKWNSSEGNKFWDYQYYEDNRPTSTLVPLEFVFRFGVPGGSSLMERAQDGEYLKDLGLSHPPKEGGIFERPVVEFSTKLEEKDRYISYSEAQRIAGLTDYEFKKLKAYVKLIAFRLKDLFSELDVTLWDGKFEFAFGKKEGPHGRSFMVVDSIGPDELRLTYDDVQLSKELLRQFYRKYPWFVQLKKAKALAKERGELNWKEICLNELKSSPPPLDKELQSWASNMYQSLAQSLSKLQGIEGPFPEAPSLKKVVDSFNQWKKEAHS